MRQAAWPYKCSAQQKHTPEQCQHAQSIGKEMSTGRPRLQPAESTPQLLSFFAVEEPAFCVQCDEPCGDSRPRLSGRANARQ
jgi:hypothetical protein